ncbi:MAG: serine dehydratase subunit alpha family protein [Candidatus Xenobiia bacterium LiM19]
MNLYKEVIQHEVFPAMGCTEPIALAYAGSLAAEGIKETLTEISFVVNQGTYKNGLAVTIPNTGGEKGNLIAGVLGCLIARPEREMEILKEVSSDQLAAAKSLIASGRATLSVDNDFNEFCIEAHVSSAGEKGVCIIGGSHTNIIYRELDNKVQLDRRSETMANQGLHYRETLKGMKIEEIIGLAEELDEEDLDYLKKGVEMNLEISNLGVKLKKVGFFLLDLQKKGFLLDDIFSSSKIITACAVDARMDGAAMPVMSSGSSGNQGIVASLVPYNVGKHFNIDGKTILKSIALSHLMNSYIKVFTGDLAPICGCAIAAGIGAACAIVYQQCKRDMEAITFAINNLVSDIGGMLCDGAKSGCALKVVSSTDAAIRAAYLGINHHGITNREGFVGLTAEDTIKNLGRITLVGMAHMDDTIVGIMMKKSRLHRTDASELPH